jgi:serine/threonine-protein kinase
MITAGTVLADRYRLSRRIAVGGMGAVWQATDVPTGTSVAVKLLHPELAGDEECLLRFRAEARAASSLDHPGVATVRDYGETRASGGGSGVVYLVMELVPGEPLGTVIARAGRCSPGFTVDVLAQAAGALHAAHERALVHRDVKPGNILVSATGRGEPLAKLTDFGIAKAADAAALTVAGRVMGSPQYIAPERVLGSPAAPAGDVYSLATCGYECLAGVRPFRAENALVVATMHARRAPPPLPVDVPGELRAVIETGMAKNPDRRYATGAAFAAALAAVRPTLARETRRHGGPAVATAASDP